MSRCRINFSFHSVTFKLCACVRARARVLARMCDCSLIHDSK